MQLISKEERKNKKCYFCNNEFAKYIVALKPNINAKVATVFCCNKCALIKRKYFV